MQKRTGAPLVFWNRPPAGSSAWNGYWLPNPLCTNFEQFEFLGRLMAGCILSAERVVINMPAFYWKQLAGVPTTIEEYYAEGCAVGDRGKECASLQPCGRHAGAMRPRDEGKSQGALLPRGRLASDRRV